MDSLFKTVDLLLLKRFAQVLFFLFLLFLSISFVLVMFDSMRDLMEAEAPLHLSTFYILLRVPHEILKATPLVVVIGISLLVSDLMRNNELIMLLIAGYSPLRLLAPIAGMLVSLVLVLFLLYENVAGPASLMAHNMMETQIKGGGTGLSLSRGIWMHGENNRIYYVDTYLPHEMKLSGFTMFEFRGPNQTISQRFDAESAVWQPTTGFWTLQNVTVRNIHPDGSIDRDIKAEDDYDLERTPKDFERVTMDEELMSHSELRRMVEMSGENNSYYKASLRIKEAFPFAVFFLGMLAFVMTLYAGSGGRASGVGGGLLLVIGYYLALSLGKSFSNAGVLAPWLGAWYPNFLTLAAAVYFYWQLRKTT